MPHQPELRVRFPCRTSVLRDFYAGWFLRVFFHAVLVAGFYEGSEERVRLQGLGLEFRMELAAEEEGVAGNLDDLDVGRVGGGAGDARGRRR